MKITKNNTFFILCGFITMFVLNTKTVYAQYKGGIADGYASTLGAFSFGPSSVQNIKIPENLISIYPNPVEDIITFQCSRSSEIVIYKIFNTKGQIVLSGNFLNLTTFSTEVLVPGIYHISFEATHLRETKTMVKIK